MEDKRLSVIRDVWSRTTGRPVKDPSTQYVLESVFVEIETNGIPDSPESCFQKFEELACSADGVDADDAKDFCEGLFAALLEIATDEEDDALQPGQCEICERKMPLTKHHLFPKALHSRLRKQNYDKTLLSQTADICRLCHNAVHRFYTEKQLAMEFNTVEKLMQSENIARHARWANALPLRHRRVRQ